MYILLLVNEMSVVAKYPKLFPLSDFALIELGDDIPYTVFQSNDFRVLSGFTTEELARLYENSTGVKFPGSNRNALMQCLIDAFDSMECTEINPEEADIQAEFAQRNNLGPYKYVLGARRPAVRDDGMHTPTGLRTTLPETVVNRALAGEYPALYKQTQPQAAPQAPQQAD